MLITSKYCLIKASFDTEADFALAIISFKAVLLLLNNDDVENDIAAFSASVLCVNKYFEPVTPLTEEDENEMEGFKIKLVNARSSGYNF